MSSVLVESGSPSLEGRSEHCSLQLTVKQRTDQLWAKPINASSTITCIPGKGESDMALETYQEKASA